jgi:hypothetical protein
MHYMLSPTYENIGGTVLAAVRGKGVDDGGPNDYYVRRSLGEAI